MAAYAGWRLLRPTDALLATAGLALLTAFTVEISQLIRGDWLDTIRSTRLGMLLLGRGFLWSDLVAYAGGTGRRDRTRRGNTPTGRTPSRLKH